MKNKPLALQIWVLISALSLGIFILMYLLIPPALDRYFSREMIDTIEREQSTILQEPQNISDDRITNRTEQELQDARSVQSFLLHAGGKAVPSKSLPPEAVLRVIYKQALAQYGESQRYSYKVQDQRLFYVIRQIHISGRDFSLVSYMWDTYYTGLVHDLKWLLIRLMGTTLLISLIPSLVLARYLSKPLVRLEGFVKKIADRALDEPVTLDRKDEIGRLAESIEKMREQLRRQEEHKQSTIQHVSHELKTPVMVIRSYIQSIQDGIFPQGNLQGSLKVMEAEAERLDKRIRDLLYLTKLDFIASQKPVRHAIDLDSLIESAADRLRWRRPELEWRVELTPITIMGDPDQWTAAIENILDNQIRYAQNTIWVHLTRCSDDSSRFACVVLGNDGAALESQVIERLFQPYQKGTNGQFGLGLAIAYRVVSLHQASIYAENTPEGVRFIMKIPAIE